MRMEHLTKEELMQFKKMLEDEKNELESDSELGGIAVKDTSTEREDDWIPKLEKNEGDVEAEDDVAQRREEQNRKASIVGSLEARYSNVLRALKKIEEGTYGVCEISGDQIEKERLNANPAARTNIANRDVEEFPDDK